MGVGPFSSESSSKQKHVDRSVQASDQAVVYQPQNSGNQRNPIKLAKGATLTVNQGVDADQFQAGLSALAESLSANVAVNPPSDQDDSFRQALLLSLDRRAAANTDRAVDEATSSSPSTIRNYVAWGVGLVVLLALVLVFRKSK